DDTTACCEPRTRCLSSGWEGAEAMKCKDVMWESPVTLSPEETVQAAVRKLTHADVSALPVVDERGRYLGMVTERALVREVMAEGLDPKLTRVTLILDRRVPVCEPDDPVAVALKRMDEARTRWIAVLRGGRVIGLIGARDIRRAAGKEDIEQFHALREAALFLLVPVDVTSTDCCRTRQPALEAPSSHPPAGVSRARNQASASAGSSSEKTQIPSDASRAAVTPLPARSRP